MVPHGPCGDSRPRLSGMGKAQQGVGGVARRREMRLPRIKPDPALSCQRVVPLLHTSRLLLRPLELADASQTQLLFPHWEIVRYLSKTVPWPYPADGAHSYYRD